MQPDAVYQKGQSRLHFLRNLRSFNVSMIQCISCISSVGLLWRIQSCTLQLSVGGAEPGGDYTKRDKVKNIMNDPECPHYSTVIQQQCLQSEASSDLLQHRDPSTLQEILHTHNNHLQ